MIQRPVIISLLLCFSAMLSAQSFTEPALSKDGKMLAFNVRTENGKKLHTARVDGTDIKPLVDLPGSGPNWSPDGQSLVFYTIDDNNKRELYTINRDGSKLRNLTQGKLTDVQSPQWTDNQRIIFSDGQFPSINVYSMSENGSDITALTKREGLNYYADMVGEALVYGHASRSGRGIFYRASAEAETMQLSNSGEAPVLSPDGHQVAFQDGHRTGSHIYIIDLKNQEKRQLTEGHSSELPEWSPDGKWIFYQRKIDDRYEIWKINIGSGQSTAVMTEAIFKANR